MAWSSAVPADQQLPQPLDHHERRVPLVGMPHSRVDAQGTEHAYAPDAEDPLLPHPQVGSAGVQLVHQAAVVRVVELEVGVEQVDRHPAHHDAPRAHVHRPARGLHHREERLALGSADRLQRRERDVILVVAVLLPPVGAEALVEVALHVHEPDADQRDADVAGGLAVVAGQDAETAGVDRHRAVQPEFGAEVRDRPRVELGVVPGEPGVLARSLVRHPHHHLVVAAQEIRLAGARRDPLGIHPAEQLQRIVTGHAPEYGIDAAEETARLAIPAPPEVLRDGREAFDADGQVGNVAGLDSHRAVV